MRRVRTNTDLSQCGLRSVCRACGARFALLKQHQRHLQFTPPCHAQAAFERPTSVEHLPIAGPEISMDLLRRLRQKGFNSDCEIFEGLR